MKYRFGFVLSTALGNKTRYENFKTFADLDSDIEIVWAPVKHYLAPGEANPFWFLPHSLFKRAVVIYQSWPVLRELGTFDAVMIHMYEIDILLALRSYLFSSPPRAVSTDDAPVIDPANYPVHPVDKDKSKWRQAIRLRLDIWRARKADLFIPFSNWAANILIKDVKISAKKVFPIHVGLNLNFWHYQPRSLDTENCRCRILFVGGDFERKGGLDLLAVFREDLMSTCELHLVTKQPPSSLPDHVYVHTDFESNDSRLAELYRTSDIFVLPTYADLSSWVVLEAMASGCATISTPVGGIVDIVRHGESGWLVAPGDRGGLLGAIKSLVDNPILRVQMGAAGRKIVENNFNAQINVPKILEAMKTMADAKSANRNNRM